MQKSIFQQIMTPGDWIKLIILIVIFIISWLMVLRAYSTSLDYNEAVNQILSESI